LDLSRPGWLLHDPLCMLWSSTCCTRTGLEQQEGCMACKQVPPMPHAACDMHNSPCVSLECPCGLWTHTLQALCFIARQARHCPRHQACQPFTIQLSVKTVCIQDHTHHSPFYKPHSSHRGKGWCELSPQ